MLVVPRRTFAAFTALARNALNAANAGASRFHLLARDALDVLVAKSALILFILGIAVKAVGTAANVVAEIVPLHSAAGAGMRALV